MRVAFRPLVQLCVVSALLVSPAIASAQQAAAERAASARSDYRRAHAAALRSDWTEARRILRELWAKSKTYDVAASLSEAEYALGHAAVAASYMDYALRHVTPNESAATVENMKAALAQILPKVAVVELTANEPVAAVSIDGEAIEMAGETRIFLEPGAHLLRAQAGERERSIPIDAAAGSVRTLRIDLPASPAVTAPPQRTFSPPSDAHDTGSPPRTIAIVIGGALAVGGLGTGIGFGLASNASERDAEIQRGRVGTSGCPSANASPDCAALRDAIDDQRRESHLANLGYGVAAAGLVTVGVALLWPRSRAEGAPRSSAVALRWSGRALLLSSEF